MDLADMDGRYLHDIFTIPLSIMGNYLTYRCQLSVQDSPEIYLSSKLVLYFHH